MRISQRPLACYVMALSRQTARTFPGHRTSINYRSFHEQLHRFSKLPVFARYIAEKSQIWKNVWICRRKIVGSAEISFENRSIEPIFLFFFYQLVEMDFNLFELESNISLLEFKINLRSFETFVLKTERMKYIDDVSK